MAKAPDATAVVETKGYGTVGAPRSPGPAASRAGRGYPSAALRSGRVNGLDGLRTLAVALVLVYHVDHTLVPGGSVAVDVFFTISGFVITRLLLAEYSRTGTIALLAFYRRRWTRLVPALLAVCAVCVLLATTTSLWSFEGSWQAVGLAAAFVTNVFRAMESGPYSGGPLAHTWSLGVEEQFYFLWPLLLLLLLRRLRAQKVLLCTATLCVLPFLWRCVLWNPDATHRIYNGTDTRADQLLAGALVAVVLARLQADDPRLELLRTWAGRLAVPALSLLALVAWQVPITGDNGTWTALWYTVGFLGVAATSATLVAGLELRPDTWLSRLLSWEPLAWIGRNLSYGIYLWHYPVVRLLASLGVQDGRLSATVVLTVTMALLSYYLVERPFLRRAQRRASSRQRHCEGIRPGLRVGRPNSAAR
ncbi:acyltransferase [Streptomyces sp. S3(2020)]|uniref:acyltransferase family protein n=1 Tax=Streptomyces sp. S3(2020) TaxID=2732044 RepID=UPI001488B492|nr:acyltransferase [Streptomyces sp. S3(2020)]NNN31437.1 acyltransferase [Streptomyces sp. S3(2020)]